MSKKLLQVQTELEQNEDSGMAFSRDNDENSVQNNDQSKRISARHRSHSEAEITPFVAEPARLSSNSAGQKRGGDNSPNMDHKRGKSSFDEDDVAAELAKIASPNPYSRLARSPAKSPVKPIPFSWPTTYPETTYSSHSAPNLSFLHSASAGEFSDLAAISPLIHSESEGGGRIRISRATRRGSFFTSTESLTTPVSFYQKYYYFFGKQIDKFAEANYISLVRQTFIENLGNIKIGSHSATEVNPILDAPEEGIPLPVEFSTVRLFAKDSQLYYSSCRDFTAKEPKPFPEEPSQNIFIIVLVEASKDVQESNSPPNQSPYVLELRVLPNKQSGHSNMVKAHEAVVASGELYIYSEENKTRVIANNKSGAFYKKLAEKNINQEEIVTRYFGEMLEKYLSFTSDEDLIVYLKTKNFPEKIVEGIRNTSIGNATVLLGSNSNSNSNSNPNPSAETPALPSAAGLFSATDQGKNVGSPAKNPALYRTI